jgi:hypothetical protein
VKLILYLLQHGVFLLHLASPLLVLFLECPHLAPQLLLGVPCPAHGLFELEMLDLQLASLQLDSFVLNLELAVLLLQSQVRLDEKRLQVVPPVLVMQESRLHLMEHLLILRETLLENRNLLLFLVIGPAPLEVEQLLAEGMQELLV